MKTLSLTIMERLSAIAVFNNPENKVSMENMKTYLEDASKFGIKPDEKTEIGWQDLKEDKENPQKITGFKWDKSDYEKNIEIDEFTRKFLLDKISKLETYAGDPYALSMASLQEKLK